MFGGDASLRRLTLFKAFFGEKVCQWVMHTVGTCCLIAMAGIIIGPVVAIWFSPWRFWFGVVLAGAAVLIVMGNLYLACRRRITQPSPSMMMLFAGLAIGIALSSWFGWVDWAYWFIIGLGFDFLIQVPLAFLVVRCLGLNGRTAQSYRPERFLPQTQS
jgi:hypothetical protein